TAKRPMPDYPLFPGINAGWDNEPRRSGRGRVYAHASPRGYEDWLKATIENRVTSLPTSRRLIFVNAWNEWAEGAVLEPDARLGHAWLAATRRALQQSTKPAVPADPRPCAVIHVWYVELLDEMISALQACDIAWRVIITTTPDRTDAVQKRLHHLGLSAEIIVA